jgi:VCBS repeat-containing protein
VASDDSTSTNEGTTLTVSAPGVLDNDNDPDGDSLSVTEVNGTPSDVGSEITLSSGALLTLNGGGSYEYDPNGQFDDLAAGQSATDSFEYTVSDGNGGTDTGTVTVTVDSDQSLFEPGQPVEMLDSFVTSVTAGDFDGDGNTDLAAGNYQGSYSTNEMAVRLGNGDGTFKPEQRIEVSNAQKSLAAGDFDGDGLSDLVMSDQSGGGVSVLPGQEDGTFAPEQSVEMLDSFVTSVTTGDFDGDGNTDLAAGNYESSEVAVRLGNGDGTFEAEQRIEVSDSPVSPASGVDSLATGDFNGDGMADLATASGGLSVLLATPDANAQRVTIGDDDRGVARFENPDGRRVTVALRGGTADLTLAGDDLSVDSGRIERIEGEAQLAGIAASATTARSALRIAARSEVSVGDVRVEGDLGRLVGPNVSLAGDLSVTGGLRALRVGDIAAQQEQSISIDESSTSMRDGVSIVAGRLSDASIDSGVPVRRLVISEWEDPSRSTVDELSAPSMNALVARGERGAGDVAGDFEGEVSLTDGSARQTLRRAVIRGDLEGASGATDWDIAGDVGSIVARGGIEDLGLSANQIRTIRALDGISGGSIEADSLRALISRGDLDASLSLSGDGETRGSTLGRAVVRGNLMGEAGETDWNIGGDARSVVVRGATQDFGLSGEQIRTIRALDGISGGSIEADSLRALVARGDVDTSLSLSGDGVDRGPTLGRAVVRGSLIGEEGATDWEIGGDARAVVVRGSIQEFGLSAGDLRTLRARGGISGGELDANSLRALVAGGDVSTSLLLSGEDVQRGRTLGRAVVRGNLLGDTGDVDWEIGGDAGVLVVRGSMQDFGLSGEQIRTIRALDGISGGSIEADALRALVARGDVDASLSLSGDGVERGPTLGRAVVRGDLGNGSGPTAWEIGGEARVVTALGAVTDFSLSGTTSADLSGLRVLRLGDATEASVDVSGDLRVLRASSLSGSSVTADTMRAMIVRGDMTGGSSLTLSEAPERGRSLGRMVVRGELADGTVRTRGSVGAVVTGALRDSRLIAGAASGATLPATIEDYSSGDFENGDASIGRVVARGLRGESGPSLALSDIAAPELGVVRVIDLERDNAQDVPFGVAANDFRVVVADLDGNGRADRVRPSDVTAEGGTLVAEDFRVRLV